MATATTNQGFTRRGWQLFAAMSVIWGLPYLFIKVAVEELSPPVVVFGRSALAALVLVPLALHRDAIRPALRHWRPLLAFATIEIAGPWVLLTHAEEQLPSGLTGLLIATVPLVGTLVAFALGDRAALRPVRLLGLATGIVGVGLLVGFDLGLGSASLVPLLEVLVVVVCYATAPFIADRRLRDVPSVGTIAGALTFVSLVYLPFALAFRPSEVPSARVVGSILVLAFVCTATAFVVFFALIAEVGAARSTLITFINPAVAILLGAVVLGEAIGPATVAGFVFVLAGCWLATRPPRSEPRALDHPHPEAPVTAARYNKGP